MSTSKNEMIANFKSSANSNVFLSTDSTAILISLKSENFKTASKHFHNKDALFKAISELIIKLEATLLSITLKNVVKIEYTLPRDRDFEQTLSLFLNHYPKHDDIRELIELSKQRFVVFVSEFL
jgi:hypothetical protein